MAENHQERCNPAIHAAGGVSNFNNLEMAKNMQVTTANWYEVPIYDTSSLDRTEPVYWSRRADGSSPADRRMASVE
jgi:hypothetical protein